MKCEYCGYENLEDSFYCEECGKKLGAERPVKKNRLEDEIEDVVFVPKKKSSTNWAAIVVLVLILAFLGFLYLVGEADDESLSSPTSTSSQSAHTPRQSPFRMSDLQLLDEKMVGNSYSIPNPVYTATLHNSGSSYVSDVVMRFNFYSSGNPNAVPVDTRYITVAEIMAPGDSTSINTIIETNANTSGDFWWRAEIFNADELE